jgi:hypothetical protein
MARAEPVAIEKYGRSVVVVLAGEEFQRLTWDVEPRRSKAWRKKSSGRTRREDRIRIAGKF